MFLLNDASLPEEAEQQGKAIAFFVDTVMAPVFKVDPLATLKRFSSPFEFPTIPNPEYVATGYLYKIPKTSSEAIVELYTGAIDAWETADYFYVMSSTRSSLSFQFSSSSFTYPVYEAESYAFDLSDTTLFTDASVTYLEVGGSRFAITSDNLSQSGNTVTLTPGFTIAANSVVTIAANAVYDDEPYGIVHTMNYAETSIANLLSIDHLTRTYQRSLDGNYSHYQFHWDSTQKIATLFLPMEWEYTIKPSKRSAAITIGLMDLTNSNE